METAVEEDAEDGDDSSQDMMCEPGTHKWKHDLCMVCTICRECTGYSISCLSSMRPDRNPGQCVIFLMSLAPLSFLLGFFWVVTSRQKNRLVNCV